MPSIYSGNCGRERRQCASERTRTSATASDMPPRDDARHLLFLRGARWARGDKYPLSDCARVVLLLPPALPYMEGASQRQTSGPVGKEHNLTIL